MITRFAPTPSGHLHLGNFYNLIWILVYARKLNAKLALRIDDYDHVRYRSHFVDSIFRTLEHAKIQWDLGPVSTKDFEKNHSSRLRLELYRQAEAKLRLSGQVYWCTCTRKMEPGLLYSGRCKTRQLREQDTAVGGLSPQLRFAVSSEFLKQTIGDFIVIPRGGEVSYQLASVVDDLYFGYDLIVRGEDLKPSTEAQRELAAALGEPRFEQCRFVHHKLLMGAKGQKLSKSQKAEPVYERLQSPGGLRDILKQFAEAQKIKLSYDVPDTIREFVERFYADLTSD